MLEEKAKITWLKEGDRNTQFFHASIRARRSQNAIKLELEDGSFTDYGDYVGQQAANYFNKLFGEFPKSGFFEGLHIPNSISSTNIVLLPKVKRAGSMDQVRPISLCNFIHKIISKILNSGLASVLHKLISPEQSGFVYGRNMHECIGLAHGMVRDINIKTFGGNIMLKIDMSKAYDRLSWRFILKMLAGFGLSNSWIDLIYRNISNY
ncbi:hypothetical protein QQ045_029062 [Rhodiola kirilowii]